MTSHRGGFLAGVFSLAVAVGLMSQGRAAPGPPVPPPAAIPHLPLFTTIRDLGPGRVIDLNEFGDVLVSRPDGGYEIVTPDDSSIPLPAGFQPRGLNDLRQVVGSVPGPQSKCGSDALFPQRGALWDGTEVIELGVVYSLDLPDCELSTIGIDLDDDGTVVGTAIGPGDWAPVMWVDGVGSWLTDANGDIGFGRIEAINRRDEGAGVAYRLVEGAPAVQTFVARDGVLRWLPLPSGAVVAHKAAGIDINDRGGVLGGACRWFEGSIVCQPVLASWSSADWILDPDCTTYGLNNRWFVVGKRSVNGIDRALVWWSGEEGLLPVLAEGAASVAYRVNDANEIAGDALAADGQTHAVVWRLGVLWWWVSPKR